MSLARFARTVAHTRPRQLLERVRRIVRARLHDVHPGVAALRCRGATSELSESAPLPLFAARTERVDSSERKLRARILGKTFGLRGVIDWRAVGEFELTRMNLHYMEYLEALDDEDFARVVEDWIDCNRLDERGAWRCAWNSYVVSLRVVVWMQQLALRRDRLGAATQERMRDSLGVQMRFLERHLELDVGGNHLIKNAKALLWSGACFEGDEALRWSRLGERILTRELSEQVFADGMHYERSPSYHAQVFADLVECARIARPALRDPLSARLRDMAQVLVDLTHADGAPSLFNDGGMHMSYSTEQCLAAYERIGGVRPEPRDVFALPDAGYVGARNEESLLIADCGALGPNHLPAHGHGDALAFEWTLYGKRVIVDAGVHEYERGALRDEARSTRSHNTVTLDDRDQSEFWAAFRVGRRARVELHRFETLGRGFVLEAAHDGYSHLAGAPRHVRRFIVGRDSVVVDDEVQGGARQSVRARLMLHPDARVESVAQGLAIRIGDLSVLVEARHPMLVADAFWCPDFGVRLPTKQIVISYSPAPCHGSFRLTKVNSARSSSLRLAIAGLRAPERDLAQ